MQTSRTIRGTGIATHRPVVRGLMLAGLLGLPALALGQVVANPVEVEGPISAISANVDGSATISLFGRPFIVPVGTPISTPTKSLSIEELVDTTPFPGRTQPGFVGGTAIMTGVVNNGVTTIENVFVEPAENVLLGEVTANAGGVLKVLGIPLVAIADPRIPPSGVHNIWGFKVKPETIPVGAGAAVEGYFGAADNTLHYFTIEADGGDLVDSMPQTSVTRARCEPGSRLELQGGAYLPNNSRLEVRNAKTGFVFGQITTIPSVDDPRFGDYRYRVDVNNSEVDSDGACPSEVRVVNLSHSPQTEATHLVDGVAAPPPAPATNFPPLAVDDAENVYAMLATTVELLGNDTDINGNQTIDPTSVVVGPISDPNALFVTNNANGTVTVLANSSGVFTFTYTVADADGARSNAATVTITSDVAPVDVIDATRANYRTSQSRWNVRGTSSKPGTVVTLELVRNNVLLGTIGSATADAAGAWALDVRSSPLAATVGDIVKAASVGGGRDEIDVTITR